MPRRRRDCAAALAKPEDALLVPAVANEDLQTCGDGDPHRVAAIPRFTRDGRPNRIEQPAKVIQALARNVQ